VRRRRARNIVEYGPRHNRWAHLGGFPSIILRAEEYHADLGERRRHFRHRHRALDGHPRATVSPVAGSTTAYCDAAFSVL
jgi:hypothetical protein